MSQQIRSKPYNPLFIETLGKHPRFSLRCYTKPPVRVERSAGPFPPIAARRRRDSPVLSFPVGVAFFADVYQITYDRVCA